jgi:hypothetical protein
MLGGGAGKTCPTYEERHHSMSKRTSRRMVHVLAAAGISAVFLVSGCTLQDAICNDGEYPSSG